MNLPGDRIAACLGKAALKTHAFQTLTRGPLTRPEARSVWSASDLSALSVRRGTASGSCLQCTISESSRLSMNRPTPDPSQEGSTRSSASCPFPSREGLGVGSWLKNGRELPTTPTLPCQVELRFGRGDIDFSRIHVGDKVWKTSDPELDRRLRSTFAGDQPKFERPIQMEVHGRIGQPLTLIARDEVGDVVQVASALPLAKAEKQPLTTERLREQLGRLGGTAFKVGELKNRLE